MGQSISMASIPKKVSDRISEGLKRFQPIIQAAKARDAGESDTVTIITDCLTEIFGYDKYSEVTSEHAIRGTYVDLAIKVNDTLLFLIEAKAIGLTLNDKKQNMFLTGVARMIWSDLLERGFEPNHTVVPVR